VREAKRHTLSRVSFERRPRFRDQTGDSMERPAFLSHLPEETALDVLRATVVATLPALVDENVVLTSELDYGYEDLPIAGELAGHLRAATAAWHTKRGAKTDFRALRRAFENAFSAGLAIGHQIHAQDGDGLRLDLSALTDLESEAPFPVPESLKEFMESRREAVRSAFAAVQDKQLLAAASTGNQDLLGDFLAATCLWAFLAGVEAGLAQLEGL
jgi:hypothetical protein